MPETFGGARVGDLLHQGAVEGYGAAEPGDPLYPRRPLGVSELDGAAFVLDREPRPVSPGDLRDTVFVALRPLETPDLFNEYEAAWLDEGFNSYTDSEVMVRVYGKRRASTSYAGLPVWGRPVASEPSA